MGATDDDAAARSLLSGRERIAAKAAGKTPAEYVRETYGPVALAEAKDDGESAPASRGDTGGASDASGGRDADALALRAMDGSDRLDADARNHSPSTYLRTEYDIDVRKSKYQTVADVHDEIRASLEGGR